MNIISLSYLEIICSLLQETRGHDSLSLSQQRSGQQSLPGNRYFEGNFRNRFCPNTHFRWNDMSRESNPRGRNRSCDQTTPNSSTYQLGNKLHICFVQKISTASVGTTDRRGGVNGNRLRGEDEYERISGCFSLHTTCLEQCHQLFFAIRIKKHRQWYPSNLTEHLLSSG